MDRKKKKKTWQKKLREARGDSLESLVCLKNVTPWPRKRTVQPEDVFEGITFKPGSKIDTFET
jgi:hypothetical protein